jgi:hypothetical protein
MTSVVGNKARILRVSSGLGTTAAEWLAKQEVAARRAHEFALIVEPLKIQDGTRSTVAPIAVR